MQNISCAFSYDYYQTLAHVEEGNNIPEMLRRESNFMERGLTDKIRTNKEVASFIRNMINLNDKPQKQINYKNIDVIYANDYDEALKIVEYYCEEKNYTFIGYINTHRVIGNKNLIELPEISFLGDET